MKARLLTTHEAKGVEKWLSMNPTCRKHHCPFFLVPIQDHEFERCRICNRLFTKLKKEPYQGNCPCSIYSHKYIIKKAKGLVADFYSNSSTKKETLV